MNNSNGYLGNGFKNYSRALTTTKCCSNFTKGPRGPTGPTGGGARGPIGKTGKNGFGDTGPTGMGCTGSTGINGSQGLVSSVTGPTGPTGVQPRGPQGTPAPSSNWSPTGPTGIYYNNSVLISGNLDLSSNLIQDVSGIYFCDGTYLGHGNSFDLSLNQQLKILSSQNISIDPSNTLLIQGNIINYDTTLSTPYYPEKIQKYSPGPHIFQPPTNTSLYQKYLVYSDSTSTSTLVLLGSTTIMYQGTQYTGTLKLSNNNLQWSFAEMIYVNDMYYIINSYDIALT